MNTTESYLPSICICKLVSGLIFVLLCAGCSAPQLARSLAGPDDKDHATYATQDPAQSGVSAPRSTLRRLPPPDAPAMHEGRPDQILQVAHQEADPPVPDGEEPLPEPESLPGADPLPPPSNETVGQEPYPIDLPTALQLAGANNLQIGFATEQIEAAVAQMERADVNWVPSINAGLIYNNHAGRLQETEGEVIEVSRNSLFVGAGAVTATSPAAGASGGPARMFVDFPIIDALFEPLAARQVVRAAEANEAATFNDTLLQVAVSYLDLLRAHARVSIAQEEVDNAAVLAEITEDFAREGEGLEADAQRLQAELNRRRGELLRVKESVAVASAELARLLRLDPAVTLVPTEVQVVPLDVVEGGTPLRDLIGMALAARPEVDDTEAVVDETWLRFRREQLRPWMPHLYAGFSGGGFGGGPGGAVDNFSDRTDFDVAAIWQLENFGLGNRARQRQQESMHAQAHLAAGQVRDQIASEVSRAYHQVELRRGQIDTARPQIRAAEQALQLNLDGIRGGVLRAIEAQQAIRALAAARQQYLDSVVDFNQSQFELLRAIGQPPYEELAH